MSDTSPPPPPYAGPYTEEKKTVHSSRHPDVEAAVPSGRARWLGGANVAIGRRIAPVLASTIPAAYSTDSDDSSSAILHKQKEAEANATIKYRTCSWQKVCAAPPRVPLPPRVAMKVSREPRDSPKAWC